MKKYNRPSIETVSIEQTEDISSPINLGAESETSAKGSWWDLLNQP